MLQTNQAKGKGSPGWVLWSDIALRRNSGSRVSPTGPVSRRAATLPSHRADKPTSRRARERQENEPTSPTPTPRTVHQIPPANAVSPDAAVFRRSRCPPRMRCPDTAMFRPSPPLVARSLTRLAIRSDQSHPGLYTHLQQLDR